MRQVYKTVTALGAAAVLGAALLGLTAKATASDRLALVIGNGGYYDLPPLDRAVADARAVRDALLTDQGFQVFYAEDAGAEEFAQTIGAFLGAAGEGDLVAVYFTGYGEAVGDAADEDGVDALHLLPIDAPAVEGDNTAMFARYGASVADIRGHLERRGVALRLFALDARPISENPTTRGLGRIAPAGGEAVLLSAQPGRRGLDRLNASDTHPNSVFARVFLDSFDAATPLRDMAEGVKLGVAGLAMSADQLQEPVVEIGALETACFAERCSARENAFANDGAATGGLRIEPIAPPAAGQAAIQPLQPIPSEAQPQIEPLGPVAGGGAAAIQPLTPTTGAPPAQASQEPTQAELDAAETAYRDASARGSRTGLQLVAQVYPNTYWGRVALLDVEQARIEAEAAEALARIDEARDALEWERIRLSRDVGEIDAFMREHGAGPLAQDAAAVRAALLEDLRAGQVELRRLRYYWSGIDGDWGRGSQAAMRAFQTDIGVEPDGRLTKTMLALLLAEPTPPPSVRTEPPARVAAPSGAASAPVATGWRYVIELSAVLENNSRERCVSTFMASGRAIDTGRRNIECRGIDGYALNVSSSGLLIEGTVYAGADEIALRGKNWSFVGAGWGGGDIDTVKIVVRRQAF